ncbi:nitrate reductase [Ruegeria sp. HKCCD6157]|uniref:nitrate reductase n=1 Tax=Ruegeria sp. HKCCD6157 TaxID=2690707 RepID=UPI001492620C|nr:nitrate reductase [Ruegeria sp. HKCCD6157]NOE25119.1 molybdopterin-dependent oxidoreductase [Ruegeria sp. HKCCD6157]
MDGTGLPEVRSTCAYCGVGCGVLLRPDGAGGLTVRGDPDHPANYGRLCSKGLALDETVGLDHRLLAPCAFGQDTSWDNALQLVADRFSATIREFGPDSVAFYVSGQLLTEDYYVANKLMKGFIGSANIDTNSRLCMASTVAGHKRAFGTDTVPGTYEDLDHADLVVLVGSNLAWCHPVLYQRVMAARQAHGTKIVVIDPRRTASCDQADLHLPLKPGSDVALFNRLLCRIHHTGHVSAEFLERSNGFSEALELAQLDDPDETGLSPSEIEAYCDLWIGTERVVTVFSQGVNQSSSGTDKVNAILNCHLATGRIGREGMGPFSVTGQPNAMGGREVGGLANTLACHLDIENEDHRQAVKHFWNSPNIPRRQGLKAVDLFRSIEDGQIKALWIIHTNPAATMPDADRVSAAIENCPFTVVSDLTARTDTARIADVLLPAAGWAEKSGTVTNSDRTISRQRAVLSPPGQARSDWDILAEVGRRMGWEEAFNYNSPAQIFREYASMTSLAASFGKDFNITELSDIGDEDYDALSPTQWPTTLGATDKRFFGDGQFFHPDGKARIVPVSHKPPKVKTCAQFPFLLNTGRNRDQWHTMTRSGLSPRLSAHLSEPYVDMNPTDVDRLGLSAADLVQLDSSVGSGVFRLRISEAVAPGQAFAPIHWTGETAPSARVDALVPSVTDPISGQPESKATAVSVRRLNASWYGFAISVDAASPTAEYWARSKTDKGYRMELAGKQDIDDWEHKAREWFGLPDAMVTSIEDPKRGSHRIALSDGQRLLAALFISRQPIILMRDYLASLPEVSLIQILSGRSSAASEDCGPIVCSCFGVGLKTIIGAIRDKRLINVDDIGDALQAGTNCGSCRPELAELVAEHSKLNRNTPKSFPEKHQV